MKTRTKYFVVALSLIFLCAKEEKSANIEKASWLIGSWENKTPRGSIYETWSKTNDLTLTGKSYIIKDKDTIVFETIELVEEQDKLIYIPKVKNQNEGLPIRFINKTITETQLVFENAQHDFPQIITYTKMNADSLVAEISGIKNGQQRKQTFPMKRMK